MNQATLKSRATLIGKVFASKGVTLTRAEQLNLVAQLEGARNWHHASAETAQRSSPRPFDQLQREAAQAYASGDFAYMNDDSEIADCGDTLFSFVIREVGDASGEREEAVRMMRTAARELEEVADHLERSSADANTPSLPLKPLGHQATNSKGESAGWHLQFVTNRFMETQPELAKEAPALAAWWEGLSEEDALRLSRVCLEELGFIVALNGQQGILYEVEIETYESEGDEAPDFASPRCSVTEEQRRIQLRNDIADLEMLHPKLQWAVGGPDGIHNGRLAVWAFCPADSLISVEEAKALTESLYAKFY
jgi:hypothetical protein